METAATFCSGCRRHYEADRRLCPRCGIHTTRPTGTLPSYGEVVDERYVRLAELGVGGMSVVYRAFDATRRREVALKVIRPKLALRSDGVERFFREARLLRGLRHPNIVAPVDFGCTDGGLLYLAMELLAGESLGDVVRRSGRLPIDRALALAQQAAEALATVHRAGVLHRDLKPENFRLLPSDLLKMLDFGIAIHLGEAPAEDGRGRNRQICGTPQYMSPERALGEEEDERSDLYGLGVLLYELITGRPPFVGNSPVEIVRQHLCEATPPLAECAGISVPSGVEDLVACLLRKEPSQRPESAAATVERIRLARTCWAETLVEHATAVVPFHERATMMLLSPHELGEEDGARMTFPDLASGDAPTLVGSLVLCPHCRVLQENDAPMCRHCGGSIGDSGERPPRRRVIPSGKSPTSAEILAATVGTDPRFAPAPPSRRTTHPVVPPSLLAVVEARFPTAAYGLRAVDDSVVADWQLTCGALGGVIALDDGARIRVVFGLEGSPAPHEPAPSAAAAGLALLDALDDAVDLGVRVALCCGLVYLDDDGRGAPAWGLRGSELDVVSRLAELAEPGTLILDSRAARAIAHLASTVQWRTLPARGRRPGIYVRQLALGAQPTLRAMAQGVLPPEEAGVAVRPTIEERPEPPPLPADALLPRSTRISVENDALLC